MERKGISPLLASVLLLAVTLSVASVFSGWAPGIVKTVTESTSNQTEDTIDCNRASVEIESAKYFSSGSATSVVIRNSGNYDLDELSVEAWQSELPMNSSTISIGSGNFTTTNVTTTSKPDRIEANSKTCSSVQDEYEDVNE